MAVELPDLRGMRFLVTGGAGFIGSNLVENLLAASATVRVFDNFLSGRRGNLEAAHRNSGGESEVVVGDIRDAHAIRLAMNGIDYCLHQAAIPSVPRSIAEPEETNAVNVDGTLNVLIAGRDARVKRVVVASSSSVYGESAVSPKHEDLPLEPLSPYAVSKVATESYARVFHGVYGLPTVALRYFNVFGPRQDPASEYAAVVPNFVGAALAGKPMKIYGDGEQTRDFTYVENVVRANVAACFRESAVGKAINIAGGERVTVKALAEAVGRISGSKVPIVHESARSGDIRHSHASIDRARDLLGYNHAVGLEEGLARTVEWRRASGTSGARQESSR